eukprot:3643592-Karenia_brevis.AAC.1
MKVYVRPENFSKCWEFTKACKGNLKTEHQGHRQTILTILYTKYADTARQPWSKIGRTGGALQAPN